MLLYPDKEFLTRNISAGQENERKRILQLHQLLSQVRQAVDDYHMIAPGDRIAVGLSGGKDSMTLLYALKKLSRFYPHPYELMAFSVDCGFGNMDFEAMEGFCQDLEVPYQVIRTRIAEIVFDIRKENNPCSLCSKLRKGAFHSAAVREGCSKTAFGHHRDDLVDTMMMSLIFEGRLHTFSPVTRLDRTGLTLIRPLLYVKEADIKGFVRKYELPVLKNTCPADGATNRQYVASLIDRINRDHPGVRGRMFTAARALLPYSQTDKCLQPCKESFRD